MKKTLLGLAVAAVLAGCAVTQPLPPKTDLPLPTATAAQNQLLERWWIAFDDPVLTQLVDEALAQNLDLRASIARIEAARSQVLLAQSYLAPSIDARFDPYRSRISGVGSQPLPAGTPLISNDFRVALEMSYELDVWGKYRAGALAAQNDLVAAQYYREAVRISVAAETANAYFRLRAADAEMQVLQDTLRLRTDTVQLQRDRFEGGLIGEYDLRTAEAERSAVVADIARTKSAIDQLEAAVAVLAGRSPRLVFNPDVARGASIEAVTQVPALPEGLPAGLMERRPDIRRSEALLASSDLKIQQARAQLLSVDQPRPVVRLAGGDVGQPLFRTGRDLEPGPRARAAAAGVEGDRVAGGVGPGEQRPRRGRVPADGADRVPRGARRAGGQPCGADGARRPRRIAATRSPRPTRSRSCATTPAARRSSK